MSVSYLVLEPAVLQFIVKPCNQMLKYIHNIYNHGNA